MYLPEEIYGNANQVLVYQQNCFDLIDDIANGDVEWKRYPNLYPFGMIEGSYMNPIFSKKGGLLRQPPIGCFVLCDKKYNFSIICIDFVWKKW